MAEAGWYPDPTGEHERRWYDGAGWTDHVEDSARLSPGLGGAASFAAHITPGSDDPELTIANPGTAAVPAASGVPDRPDVAASGVNEPGERALQEHEAAQREDEALQADAPGPGADDSVDHPPVPAGGGALLVAFACLLLGGTFLPFASAGGGSAEALASDLSAAMPILVLAVAALVAAWAGRSGYDVGPALGGGAVLVFSVLLAVVAPLIKALFDIANSFGGSVEPNAGLLCFIAAAGVGVLLAIPVFGSVIRSGAAGKMPVALGWAGAGGTALYVWGATRPAYDGAPLLTGDWYVDAVLVTLLAVLVVPALLMITVRTAAAAALQAGVLLFPAMSWYQSSQGTGSGFAVTRPAGFDEMGVGLIVALCASALGVFGYARRAVRTPEGIAHMPAKSSGAAAITIAVVVLVGLVALNGSGSNADGIGGYGDPGGFTGDGAPPECFDAWASGYPAPTYCEDYR